MFLTPGDQMVHSMIWFRPKSDTSLLNLELRWILKIFQLVKLCRQILTNFIAIWADWPHRLVRRVVFGLVENVFLKIWTSVGKGRGRGIENFDFSYLIYWKKQGIFQYLFPTLIWTPFFFVVNFFHIIFRS